MCKRHWKQVHFPPPATKTEDQPPPPEGDSVWDTILPASISYRPTSGKAKLKFEKESVDGDPPPPPDGVAVMPLVAHLREGEAREAGWHRNAERRARGMFAVTSLSSQLEPWERQLVSFLYVCTLGKCVHLCMEFHGKIQANAMLTVLHRPWSRFFCWLVVHRMPTSRTCRMHGAEKRDFTIFWLPLSVNVAAK